MEPLFFTTADEFRHWLEQNHDTTKEIWVGFYKKNSGMTGINYKEAVDEALCFGWIDGIRKGIDDTSYTNRFTPRKPHSIWSQVNIKRIGELTEMGRMHPAGLKAFESRDLSKQNLYSFEQGEEKLVLPADYEAQFQANEQAWAFFQAKSPSYKKSAIWWVISAKQEATRLKRLQTLISDSENGRTIAPLTRNPKPLS